MIIIWGFVNKKPVFDHMHHDDVNGKNVIEMSTGTKINAIEDILFPETVDTAFLFWSF